MDWTTIGSILYQRERERARRHREKGAAWGWILSPSLARRSKKSQLPFFLRLWERERIEIIRRGSLSNFPFMNIYFSSLTKIFFQYSAEQMERFSPYIFRGVFFKLRSETSRFSLFPHSPPHGSSVIGFEKNRVRDLVGEQGVFFPPRGSEASEMFLVEWEISVTKAQGEDGVGSRC